MSMGAAGKTVAWTSALTLGLFCAGSTAGAAPLTTASTQVSVDAPVVAFGPSGADSIPLLAGSYYINANMAGALPYWWNHTHLTAAVHSAPTTDPADVAAVHAAIALWGSVLLKYLPDISLTDISAEGGAQSADIIVHLVPHYGGIVRGGNATCGSQKCMNITVKSIQPPGYVGKGDPDIANFDPLRVQRETAHELGHALGLGHPSPLSSIDLMGYGWAQANPDVTPVLSTCDLKGIREVFSWFYNGEPPHASTASLVTC